MPDVLDDTVFLELLFAQSFGRYATVGYYAPRFALQWLHTQGVGGMPRTEGAGEQRDYIEAFNSMEDSRACVDSCGSPRRSRS
ncbi:hypothetical protein L226DRAFT_539703 [Lentinus tigrinus ALCF2SS1-7]|uniref:uncharacterized protein n=1 Tax=Lentinus tigrinus ALCF2SS1-7 TaxID=1328758 RepID=UPI0011662513|nr:hypothetical protein L226DRAFT_539703 [Lentinus tigrinus ALCF2SS1-7]